MYDLSLVFLYDDMALQLHMCIRVEHVDFYSKSAYIYMKTKTLM